MGTGTTALIAGAAGVVAAALGAFGAVRAARHNSGTQRSSQHEQWRRVGRREAYTDFIDVAADYDALATKAVKLAWQNQQRPIELQGLLDQAEELNLRLAKAVSVIQVEGPEEVAVAAANLTRALQWRVVAARRRHEPFQPLPGGAPPPPPRPQAPPAVTGEMSNFRTMARRALDDPSGALG